LICLPPFVLLAAAGISSLKSRAAIVLMAAIAILAIANNYIYFTRFHKENWRDASEFVFSQTHAGDTVVLYAPAIRWPYDYYRARHQPRADHPTVSYPVWDAMFEMDGSYVYSRRIAQPDADTVRNIAERYRRVWLILSHDGFQKLGRAAVSHFLQCSLREKFGQVDEMDFNGVRVLLYSHKSRTDKMAHGCQNR
jgi:hypothetical protein